MNSRRKFFITIGTVLILISSYSITITAILLAKSSEVTGIVTGHKEGRGGSQLSVVYYPLVTFVCCDNQNIEFTGKPGVNPPLYKYGESVQVLFDKSKPRDARIYSFSSLWLFPLVGLGLGTFFTTRFFD